MTKPAFDQRDKSFSDWLRNEPLLDSCWKKLNITDIDFIFHKYQTHIDGQGSREVKLLFNLEVKCHGKLPGTYQSEMSYFTHQLLSKKQKLYSNILNNKIDVWHFGYYHLIICNGDRPDNCSMMKWGIFNDKGLIEYTMIDISILIKILGFDVRPDNLQKIDLRRHHKIKEIFQINRNLLVPMIERVRS